MEHGDFSMPSVYLRSFLRSYCHEVGLSFEEIQPLILLPSFESTVNETVKPRSSGYTRYQQDEKRRKRIAVLLLSVSLTVGSGTIAYHFLSNWLDTLLKPRHTELAPLEISQETTRPRDGGLLSAFRELAPKDSIELEATAFETAYLSVVRDRNTIERFTLSIGETRHISAINQIILSGNLGNISFVRNGVKLPPLGTFNGFTRQVKMTRNVVLSSTSRTSEDTLLSVKPTEVNNVSTQEKRIPVLNGSSMSAPPGISTQAKLPPPATRTSESVPSQFGKKAVKSIDKHDSRATLAVRGRAVKSYSELGLKVKSKKETKVKPKPVPVLLDDFSPIKSTSPKKDN